MRFEQVARVLDALDAVGVRHWVAGGWGVALLAGRQSRPHRDLDLVIDGDDLASCLEVLEGLGYAVETDWHPVRIELAGPDDAWVDVHPLRFDREGHAQLEMLDGSHVDYPPSAFTRGHLEGRATPCLSADQQRAVHEGYPHRDEDHHDLAVLDRIGRR